MTTYFADSIEGVDSADGLSSATAWRTLGRVGPTLLQPGDVLKLRRGSHWTEGLEIRSSGALGAPITIIGYGSGALPQVSRAVGMEPVVILDGERIVLMRVHINKGWGFGLRMRGLSSAVRYCEISNVGLGVGMQAYACAVTNCYIHDLHVVESGPGGAEDYGAVAVDCNGVWSEIAYNRFVNCICDTVEWGLDGGTVELKGNVDHARIHHNTAVNCFGFFEVGGYPGRCHDARVESNTIVDCYQLGGWHLGGGYGSDVDDFKLTGNAYYDTQDNPASVMWFHEGLPNMDTVIMENNAFMISSSSLRSLFRGVGFTHRYNRYVLDNVRFNDTAHSTELIEYR